MFLHRFFLTVENCECSTVLLVAHGTIQFGIVVYSFKNRSIIAIDRVYID